MRVRVRGGVGAPPRQGHRLWGLAAPSAATALWKLLCCMQKQRRRQQLLRDMPTPAEQRPEQVPWTAWLQPPRQRPQTTSVAA